MKRFLLTFVLTTALVSVLCGCGSHGDSPAPVSAASANEDPALLATANQIVVAKRGDWDNLSPSEKETFLLLNGNNVARAKRHYEKLQESSP